MKFEKKFRHQNIKIIKYQTTKIPPQLKGYKLNPPVKWCWASVICALLSRNVMYNEKKRIFH